MTTTASKKYTLTRTDIHESAVLWAIGQGYSWMNAYRHADEKVKEVFGR